MKLYTNFRVVLTVKSSGYARISKKTSDVSLVFASRECHGIRTDIFRNSREYYNVF